MTKYKIRLMSLELQATREPKPYWDRLATSFVASVGGKPLSRPDIPPDQVGLHFHSGFYGPGMVVDYAGAQPGWGAPWEYEFELAENAPETLVNIVVHVVNLRGIPDKDIEKILLAMGVAAAGAVVGLAADPLTTAAKWGVTIVAALGGEGLKALIEEFALKDPPKCLGTVYQAHIGLTSADLKGKPYTVEHSPTEPWIEKGLWLDSRWSDPVSDVPARGCGQPKALLTYAIETTRHLMLWPSNVKPIGFGYRGERRASLEAWTGPWSDSSSLSRVFVTIGRGSAVGADTLQVTIREAIGNWAGEIIVNLTLDNLPVTLGTHMKYWGDVFAQKSPLAPLLEPDPDLKALFVAPASITPSGGQESPGGSGDDASPAVALARSVSATATRPALLPAHTHRSNTPTGTASPAVTFTPSVAVLGASVQSSLAASIDGSKIGYVLEEALTVALPQHGITLALYAVIVADGKGHEHKVAQAVRYSRVANLWATQTDAMLTRYDPVK
jgi:hypothetical protein